MKTKDGKDKAMMNETGIPVSRWIDGVLEAKETLVSQTIRAQWFFGVTLQTLSRVRLI